MSIGDRLRKLRKLNDKTLEEVADAIGVTRQTLFKYEKGIIHNIPMDKIEELAAYYLISPNYIMGWTDDSLSSYSIQIQRTVKLMTALNEKGQTKVGDFAEVMIGNDDYLIDKIVSLKNDPDVKLEDFRFAADDGQVLDIDVVMEIIEKNKKQ